MKVTFFGSKVGKPGEKLYDAMQETARLLTTAGHTVQTGGYGGAGMEAPARGSREAKGEPFGYTYKGREPNRFIRHDIDCSVYAEEIPFSADWGIRLCGLLEDADAFVIGYPFDSGTIVELTALLHHNFCIWPKRGSARKPASILAPGLDNYRSVTPVLKQLAILMNVPLKCKTDDPEEVKTMLFSWLAPCINPDFALQWLTKVHKPDVPRSIPA